MNRKQENIVTTIIAIDSAAAIATIVPMSCIFDSTFGKDGVGDVI